MVSMGNELGENSEGVMTPAVLSRVIYCPAGACYSRRGMPPPCSVLVLGVCTDCGRRQCHSRAATAHVFSLSSLTHQGASNSIRWLWFPKQAD